MRRVIKIPLNVNISQRRSSSKNWDYADQVKSIFTQGHPSPFCKLLMVNRRLMHLNKTHVVVAETSNCKDTIWRQHMFQSGSDCKGKSPLVVIFKTTFFFFFK